MLTTMTCVTVLSAAVPPMSVLSNTPLVQKVSKVLGETLSQTHFKRLQFPIAYVSQRWAGSHKITSWVTKKCNEFHAHVLYSLGIVIFKSFSKYDVIVSFFCKNIIGSMLSAGIQNTTVCDFRKPWQKTITTTTTTNSYKTETTQK